MKIIIVGGGVGGLATARALDVNGLHDYVVIEKATELAEVGAGIQITNNAARVMKYLGLLDELEGEVESLGSTYRHLDTNELILHTPAGEQAEHRYGVPYFQMHRARLLDVLADAVPDERIRLDSRVAEFSEDADGVQVELDGGETVRGDVLIGADGIHSVIRSTFAPPEEPAFSGVLGWRALIPRAKAASLGLDHRQHSWWGPNRSVVAYWVDGGEALNFLGLVPSEEVYAESWKQVGDTQQLRNSYRGACDTVDALVGMIDEAFITGVFDRPPLDKYVSDRIALIGDAAHPFWPYLANGGAQALEDAATLAICLARHTGEIASALHEYEVRRLPRANFIQQRSRDMEHLCHMADPAKIEARNQDLAEKMEADPSGAWLRDWLWGFDVIAAAALPPEESYDEATAALVRA